MNREYFMRLVFNDLWDLKTRNNIGLEFTQGDKENAFKLFLLGAITESSRIFKASPKEALSVILYLDLTGLKIAGINLPNADVS